MTVIAADSMATYLTESYTDQSPSTDSRPSHGPDADQLPKNERSTQSPRDRRPSESAWALRQVLNALEIILLTTPMHDAVAFEVVRDNIPLYPPSDLPLIENTVETVLVAAGLVHKELLSLIAETKLNGNDAGAGGA